MKPKYMFALLVLLLNLSIIATVPASANGRGIYGNGDGGLYLDIYSSPFTDYANKEWGQYAYGPSGCVWFASARLHQITGRDYVLWDGESWWNSQYSAYRFTKGQEYPTGKALICYSNHIAVWEGCVGDDVLVSQGGDTWAEGFGSASPSDYDYCSLRRMTKAQTKTYAKGFLGFVYITDAVPPTPKSFDFSIWSDRQWIGETSAVVATYIYPSGCAPTSVTAVACDLYDTAGNHLAGKYDNFGYVDPNDHSRLKHYYTINDDPNNENILYRLSPATTYQYRYTVWVDSEAFYSDLYTFTTSQAQITVSYNANGGVVYPESKTVTAGSTYGSLPTPTRSGYTFEGWYTAAIGGSSVTSGTTVTAQSDHTIYAHWKADVTVTFTVRPDWMAIHETDAKVGVYVDVNGTALSSVHHIRCQLFDENGRFLAEKYEPTYQAEGRITHYFNINNQSNNTDIRYALTPGTYYIYRYIVYVGSDDAEYASQYYTFMTNTSLPDGYSCLDINGMLDGTLYNGTEGFGTFDIRINGMLIMDNVVDHNITDGLYPVWENSYAIEDIRALPGYTYVGSEGPLNGAFEPGAMTVILKFVTGNAEPEITYQDMTAGEYAFRNQGTGAYLTLDGAVDADTANISVSAWSGSGQVFRIAPAEQGYKLIAACSSSGRVVNPYAYTPVDGTNVNLYHQENDGTESSQWWRFQPVNGGFILHNVMDPNLVLSLNGSNVIVSAYTGSAEQIWAPEPWQGSASVIRWEDHYCFPSKRSAYLAVNMAASESGTFSDFHLRLWDRSGNLIATKDETNSGVKSHLNIWYEVYSETGVSLQSDTEYTYQFWTTFNGTVYESPVYRFTTADGSERHFGVDVSYWQETIDWDTAAQYIDFAIIRCGYGGNITDYDDAQWQRNASACERLGIPYGVYLYSYAENDGEALDEAEHVLRLLRGHSPSLPIYYDLENAGTVGNQSNTQILSQASVFCNRLSQAGYTVGIYSNLDWWTNRLSGMSIAGSAKWLACWSGAYVSQAAAYGLWQFTSDGHVPGFGKRVDLDYCWDFDAITTQHSVPGPIIPEPDFILPAFLTSIEDETFCENAFRCVKLVEGIESIGIRAFANCPQLQYIYIPAGCTDIAEDAFDGVSGLTIIGVEGSYAETYAYTYGFGFESVDAD